MDFNDREIQTAEAEALDFLQQDMDLRELGFLGQKRHTVQF